MSEPWTPLTVGSITSTDRPRSTCAWICHTKCYRMAGTAAENTRQSIPRLPGQKLVPCPRRYRRAPGTVESTIDAIKKEGESRQAPKSRTILS